VTRKVLGVLGGMGPAATLDFLARLQAKTPATRDQDHLRVLVDINPQVPDRNDPETQPGPVMVEMAKGLRAAGAEVLAIACNTAHRYADEVARESGLPVIDMIAEAVTQAHMLGARTAGVLGTPGAVALYRERLIEHGIDYVPLDSQNEAVFMRLLYRIKSGDTGQEVREGVRELATALEAHGAEAVIAGCTEVPLVLSSSDIAAVLIDAGELLALRCIAICLSEG
jgi:aspartate racemase